MKKNNLLNKNILKKFMGAFLASVMTFGSAGQLITLASPISVQKLTKEAWNKDNKYFNEGADIKEKIKVLNILLRSIGKEEISQEENNESQIFQKVKNLSFEPNLNDNVADALKNIKKISPHAILEHNSEFNNNLEINRNEVKDLQYIFSDKSIKSIFENIASVEEHSTYDSINKNTTYYYICKYKDTTDEKPTSDLAIVTKKERESSEDEIAIAIYPANKTSIEQLKKRIESAPKNKDDCDKKVKEKERKEKQKKEEEAKAAKKTQEFIKEFPSNLKSSLFNILNAKELTNSIPKNIRNLRNKPEITNTFLLSLNGNKNKLKDLLQKFLSTPNLQKCHKDNIDKILNSDFLNPQKNKQ